MIPVPSPTGLVVKNGSKIRLRTFSGMPGPSSANDRRTPSGPRRVEIVILPWSFIASQAFMSRFRNT